MPISEQRKRALTRSLKALSAEELAFIYYQLHHKRILIKSAVATSLVAARARQKKRDSKTQPTAKGIIIDGEL